MGFKLTRERRTGIPLPALSIPVLEDLGAHGFAASELVRNLKLDHPATMALIEVPDGMSGTELEGAVGTRDDLLGLFPAAYLIEGFHVHVVRHTVPGIRQILFLGLLATKADDPDTQWCPAINLEAMDHIAWIALTAETLGPGSYLAIGA